MPHGLGLPGRRSPPPVEVCGWENQCCTVCCNYQEVVNGSGGSTGTPCTKTRGEKPSCDPYHHGCCKADNPDGIIQLELDVTGTRAPGLNNFGDDCTQEDRSGTCSQGLCVLPGSCPWASAGC